MSCKPINGNYTKSNFLEPLKLKNCHDISQSCVDKFRMHGSLESVSGTATFLTANSSRAGAVLGIMFSFCVFVTEHKLCRLDAINDNMEYQVGNSESIFGLSSAESYKKVLQ